ncbi:MAG: HGGxSTG domain-containing protein [Acidobacteriota bacterium]
MTVKPKCGAKTRAGTPCQQVAGWGTDHEGSGRCKLHGGAKPIKHGRYSKVARDRLGDILDELREADTDPLDALPDLELVRACAVYALRNDGAPSTVARLAGEAARLADQIHKRQASGAVTLETLHRVIEQLGVAVARHVRDPEALAAIERDWGSLRIGS